MKTLNTHRRYRGYNIQADFTRAGVLITCKASKNEGGEELLSLLGFKEAKHGPRWCCFSRTFPTVQDAEAFMTRQKLWRER